MGSSKRLTKKSVKKWHGGQEEEGVTVAKGEVIISLSKTSDLFGTKKMSHCTGMVRVPAGKTLVN